MTPSTLPAPWRVPPRHAARFRSDDPDEVSSWSRNRSGDHSRVVHGRGPYGFDAALLGVGSARLAWCGVGLGQTLRGAVPTPCLHVSIDQRHRYLFGREAFDVGPGAAMFVPGGWEFTRTSEAGSMMAIELSGAALQAEAHARRPGADGEWIVRPRCLELAEPALGRLRAAVDELVAAGNDARDGEARHDPCSVRLTEEVVGVLLADSALVVGSPLSARRLADLERWIDAHLAEPLTIGRLCRVAGVADRTLQQAFQARRGMSPMRFVTERRLAAAHRHLRQSGSGDKVTEVAIGVGFTHLGRFAGDYRRTYGESPSQTVHARSAAGTRRGLGAAPARGGETPGSAPGAQASARHVSALFG